MFVPYSFQRRPGAPLPSLQPTTSLLLLACLGGAFLGFARDPQASAALARWAVDPAAPTLPAALTHAFLHADLGHLLGNGLLLSLFGNRLERDLGPLWVLALFFAGVLAGVAAEGLAGGSGRLMIGASAGVAALLAVALVRLPGEAVECWVPVMTPRHLLGPTVVLPAALVVALAFAVDALALAQGWLDGVGHAAHLGGAAAGLLTTPLLGLGTGRRGGGPLRIRFCF